MPIYAVNAKDRTLYILKDETKPAGANPGDILLDSNAKTVWIYTGADNDGWVDVTAVAGVGLLALR